MKSEKFSFSDGSQLVSLALAGEGEPRIDGHRVWVRDIAAARDLGGLTPEEIAASVYPGLTLAQVYSALAYDEDHRAEIDQAMQNEADFVEQSLKDHPQLARDVRPANR